MLWKAIPLWPLIHERTTAIARVAYYDRIAKQWHRVTGYHGGAFKRYVLNDCLLSKIAGVEQRAILELGAGNGYFAPLLLRRFSGQIPQRIVISDQSPALLAIAQSAFHLDGAEYLTLDVQGALPFEEGTFDLIVASMLFNELTTTALRTALGECHRVLAPGGQLLAAVPHPSLVLALAKKGALTDFGRGLFAMPSTEGLRLPVARRSADTYRELLDGSGFLVTMVDVHPDERTLHEKAGLKVPHETPLALLMDCARA